MPPARFLPVLQRLPIAVRLGVAVRDLQQDLVVTERTEAAVAPLVDRLSDAAGCMVMVEMLRLGIHPGGTASF